MKWKVEYVTADSTNILLESATQDSDDGAIVGMGFPMKLAERVVRMHNESINETVETIQFAYKHLESMDSYSLVSGARNALKTVLEGKK